MSNWNYGDVYKKYNMEGEIKLGRGVVKVHNIFDELPPFMLKADCLFIDPPCSLANINTFYTKADRTDYLESYGKFQKRFFECIDEISPKNLFIEVFKSNKDSFIKECEKRYSYVKVYDSKYYNKSQNKCWILHCSNEDRTFPFNGVDEAKIIEWICKNVDYQCIGDLCMGRGLVGYNAFINDKPFVGTEINKKRLAVLVNKIQEEVVKNGTR